MCPKQFCSYSDTISIFCVVILIGQHVINLFVQYTPYKLSEGSWQDSNVRVC